MIPVVAHPSISHASDTKISPFRNLIPSSPPGHLKGADHSPRSGEGEPYADFRRRATKMAFPAVKTGMERASWA
jgi:hypothetical protein